MNTIDELRSQCEVEGPHPSDCWICPRRYIKVPKYGTTGPLTAMPAARAAWLLTHTEPLLPKWYVSKTCGQTGCVKPTHLEAIPIKDFWQRLAQSGALKNNPKKILANRANGRNITKLNLNALIEIRTSDTSGSELAKRYGVSSSTISLVRSGKRGLAFGAVLNPWAGLMRKGGQSD